jgi:tetratricopeptide (TPR) repeat protein
VAGEVEIASATPEPRTGELARGTQLGRYTVLKRLGHGGMGVVYLAFDPELDRRVAIKLLRLDASVVDDDSEGRTRLLREAQAMAKLSHPNVVAVHDVGTIDDELFIAMEYVEGVTLRAWQRERSPGLRDIVELYAQAGRGLAAAHAAGIFHRDFKPENVLVDAEGRARVLDFGLARVEAVPRAAAATSASFALAETGVVSGSALGASVTQVGAILGTPAYMAPEQLLSGKTDARSDQFSFAVSLYEALFGERPYAGDTLQALAQALKAGRVRPGKGGPRRLRRVLARALRPAPAERYPSMTALLDALERALGAPRRRAMLSVLALGVLLASSVTLVSAARPSRPKPCVGAEASLAGVWDAARREQASRAFHAADADRAFAGVAASLDAYGARWVAMNVDACEATRVRASQSEEVMDLRVACLGQRLKELRAATDILVRAEAQDVEHARDLVGGLGDVQGCADVAALRAPFALPRDPATAGAVEALRARVAEGNALYHVGRDGDGLTLATAVADDAARIGYLPVLADALLLRGRLEGAAGTLKACEPTFFDAAIAAETCRYDAAAARAWTYLVRVVGYELERPDEAARYDKLAEAAIARGGDDAVLRADLLIERGNVAYLKRDLDGSLAAYRAALDLYARKDPTGWDVRNTRSNIADVLMDTGEYGEALAAYTTNLAAAMAEDDLRAPEEAFVRARIGVAYLERGQYGEATTALEASLALLDAGSGYQRDVTRRYLARARAGAGDLAGGVAELRAVLHEMQERRGDSTFVAGVHMDIARAFARERQAKAALPDLELALGTLRTPGLPNGVDVASALAIRARCDASSAAAVADAREALRLFDDLGAMGVSDARFADVALGEALLARGGADDRAGALEPLERAVARCDAAPCDAVIAGDARAALARARSAARAP